MKFKHILFYTTMLFFVMFLSRCNAYYTEAQNQPETTDENYNNESDPTDIPVNLDDFQDSLSQDGNFVTITPDEIDPDQSYSDDNQNEPVNDFDNDICTSYIWVPNPDYIYEGWTPYCDGQWVWTAWGWMWISDYSWGWYPYHYGRWWHSHAYGWVWSPGYRWGPAWVDWCNSGGYCGWRPVSPRERYRNGGFENRHHDLSVDPGWVFVNRGNFTQTINRTNIVDTKTNPEIFKNATPLTGITQTGKKIFDQGPNIKEIENATGKPITESKLNLHTDNFNKGIGNKNTNISKNNPVNKNISKNNGVNTNIQKTNQQNTTVEKPKSSINKSTYSTSKSYNTTKTYNTTVSSGKGTTKQTRTTNKSGSTTKTGSINTKPYVAPKQNQPVKQNPAPKQNSPAPKQNPTKKK